MHLGFTKAHLTLQVLRGTSLTEVHLALQTLDAHLVRGGVRARIRVSPTPNAHPGLDVNPNP